MHGTRLPVPVRFDGYQSDVVCGRAAAYLGSLVGPWFAVVSLEAPHPPYGAPAAGVRGPDPGMLRLRDNVPVDGIAAARARRELSGYYAHIEATDRAIGSLLAGLPPATRIVVTSVHGDMHGSHGLFRKGWPFEESVRIPLLVREPGAPAPRRAPLLPGRTSGGGPGLGGRRGGAGRGSRALPNLDAVRRRAGRPVRPEVVRCADGQPQAGPERRRLAVAPI